jgi:hypothetical protein
VRHELHRVLWHCVPVSGMDNAKDGFGKGRHNGRAGRTQISGARFHYDVRVIRHARIRANTQVWHELHDDVTLCIPLDAELTIRTEADRKLGWVLEKDHICNV